MRQKRKQAQVCRVSAHSIIWNELGKVCQNKTHPNKLLVHFRLVHFQGYIFRHFDRITNLPQQLQETSLLLCPHSHAEETLCDCLGNGLDL